MGNLKIGLGQLIGGAKLVGLQDLVFELPLPIEPDAMQTTFSGADNVVQQRVTDIHGFFGTAVSSAESSRKDKRSGFALVKFASDKDIPKIRLETGCFYFGPLHAGCAVGEQTYMKALGQVCKEGQHVGIWLTAA